MASVGIRGITAARIFLAVAALAGATTLTLTDTADFYEPEVDQTITIGSETIVYTDADPDTDVITLATPLANAYSIGEEVLLTGSTVVAKVNVSTSRSDPVTCIVPRRNSGPESRRRSSFAQPAGASISARL